jgi:hypothetical protein
MPSSILRRHQEGATHAVYLRAVRLAKVVEMVQEWIQLVQGTAVCVCSRANSVPNRYAPPCLSCRRSERWLLSPPHPARFAAMFAGRPADFHTRRYFATYPVTFSPSRCPNICKWPLLNSIDKSRRRWYNHNYTRRERSLWALDLCFSVTQNRRQPFQAATRFSFCVARPAVHA